ncbi:MAG: acyl-CoA dehydratase activase-related protein [Butyricicoccaceae bacterium]
MEARKAPQLRRAVRQPEPASRPSVMPFGLNYLRAAAVLDKAFLRTLGFETVISDVSTRDMYMKGQHSIPSDTVCYPAKLMHGHIENLLEKGVDAIFYPCMTYNLDEGRASNCYNCPVVAYYPGAAQGQRLRAHGLRFHDAVF